MWRSPRCLRCDRPKRCPPLLVFAGIGNLFVCGNIFLVTCGADFCQQILFVERLQGSGGKVQGSVLHIEQERIGVKGSEVRRVATLPVVHGIFKTVQGFRFPQPVQNISAVLLFCGVQCLGQAANGGSQLPVRIYRSVAQRGVGFFLPALPVPVYPPVDLRNKLPVASDQGVKPFRVARIGAGQVHQVLDLGFIHWYMILLEISFH